MKKRDFIEKLVFDVIVNDDTNTHKQEIFNLWLDGKRDFTDYFSLSSDCYCNVLNQCIIELIKTISDEFISYCFFNLKFSSKQYIIFIKQFPKIEIAGYSNKFPPLFISYKMQKLTSSTNMLDYIIYLMKNIYLYNEDEIWSAKNLFNIFRDQRANSDIVKRYYRNVVYSLDLDSDRERLRIFNRVLCNVDLADYPEGLINADYPTKIMEKDNAEKIIKKILNE